MKQAQIEIGTVYAVRVSGKTRPVQVNGVSRFGGWDCTNLRTRRNIRVRGSQRFRWVWGDEEGKRNFLRSQYLKDVVSEPKTVQKIDRGSMTGEPEMITMSQAVKETKMDWESDSDVESQFRGGTKVTTQTHEYLIAKKEVA